MVAPRTGAWIETSGARQLKKAAESPLAQGRGLKQATRLLYCQRHFVAPRTGAWIETNRPMSTRGTMRRPSHRGVD